MNDPAQALAEESGKDLLNKDGAVTKLIPWATENVSSVEEMLDLFLESGVKVSHGEELTGDYQVIHSEEKQAFLQRIASQPLMVISWDFYKGENGEFVAFHGIVNSFGKFILNDGSQGGIYGQLRKTTDKRENDDPKSAGNRTSTTGLMVARGVRLKPDFWYYMNPKNKADERNGTAIPKRELAEIPDEYKRKANPVWQFDL